MLVDTFLVAHPVARRLWYPFCNCAKQIETRRMFVLAHLQLIQYDTSFNFVSFALTRSLIPRTSIPQRPAYNLQRTIKHSTNNDFVSSRSFHSTDLTFAPQRAHELTTSLRAVAW